MVKEKCDEVLVCAKDEHLQFIEALRDRFASFYAFETLYWCSLRLGEMLALTPADFDFERKIIHVIKSFQRIKGEDIITPPKTEKGIRRGCAASGVKRIRIHGIRHSHINLLIDMGFSAVAIADHVGHECIDITYRYVHIFPSTQMEVVSKLNNMIDGSDSIEKQQIDI